jgi:hypothetical protein
MPDDNTVSNMEIGAQLALALFSLYRPQQANQIVTAGNLLVAAMANYRQAAGRPADWAPTPEEWNALMESNNTEIARRLARIAELEEMQEPPTN